MGKFISNFTVQHTAQSLVSSIFRKMSCNKFDEEEFQNSEAWLAEQIFSQLKDFHTEPKNDETLKIDVPPESDNSEKIRRTDVLGLGVLANDQVSIDSQIQREELVCPIDAQMQQEEPVYTEIKTHPIDPICEPNQSAFQLFGEHSRNSTLPTKNHLKKSLSEAPMFSQQIVECANCNCIFNGSSFHQHICDYGEDNKLIVPEPMEQMMLAPFEAGPTEPPCMRLLRENQIRIRRFLKDELKYDINAGNTINKKQNGPHECTLCERKFVHASGLSRHMEKHALDLIPSPITQNNSGYSSMNGLKVVIKCTICGRILFEPKTAYEHFCVHFPETSENEFYEAVEFPYENYLDDALEILKFEVPLDFGSFYFSFLNVFFQSNGVDDQPIVYLKMVILSCVLQCEFCDLLFSEVSFLFAHSACHQPERPFECSSCEIHVRTSKEIFTHWQAECVFSRESLKRGCSAQKYYVCNVCENKFTSLENLHDHRYTAYHFFPRVDRSGKLLLLPCEYCDRVFETANGVVNHFEEKHCKKSKRDTTTTKYRQYLCDICGKTYTQSSHLWQHLRFHQGVKPFGCKEPGCSRKFTIRPDLNDHIRKCHTGERPFHCLICGRRFLTGSVFYQHRLIHRGERRYGCDECGKRFYRADALKNHLRIHTGEKPYSCLFCTKNFRQRGDRDKHIRARHSSLDAKARLMMQMRKMQLEAAARADPSSTTPADQILMLGDIPFPRSMFQPILQDIDAIQN